MAARWNFLSHSRGSGSFWRCFCPHRTLAWSWPPVPPKLRSWKPPQTLPRSLRDPGRGAPLRASLPRGRGAGRASHSRAGPVPTPRFCVCCVLGAVGPTRCSRASRVSRASPRTGRDSLYSRSLVTGRIVPATLSPAPPVDRPQCSSVWPLSWPSCRVKLSAVLRADRRVTRSCWLDRSPPPPDFCSLGLRSPAGWWHIRFCPSSRLMWNQTSVLGGGRRVGAYR